MKFKYLLYVAASCIFVVSSHNIFCSEAHEESPEEVANNNDKLRVNGFSLIPGGREVFHGDSFSLVDRKTALASINANSALSSSTLKSTQPGSIDLAQNKVGLPVATLGLSSTAIHTGTPLEAYSPRPLVSSGGEAVSGIGLNDFKSFALEGATESLPSVVAKPVEPTFDAEKTEADELKDDVANDEAQKALYSHAEATAEQKEFTESDKVSLAQLKDIFEGLPKTGKIADILKKCQIDTLSRMVDDIAQGGEITPDHIARLNDIVTIVQSQMHFSDPVPNLSSKEMQQINDLLTKVSNMTGISVDLSKGSDLNAVVGNALFDDKGAPNAQAASIMDALKVSATNVGIGVEKLLMITGGLLFCSMGIVSPSLFLYGLAIMGAGLDFSWASLGSDDHGASQGEAWAKLGKAMNDIETIGLGSSHHNRGNDFFERNHNSGNDFVDALSSW